MSGRNKLSRFFTFHIEPMILLHILAAYMIRGSGLNTTLLVWKVCKIELNLNDTICENLNDYSDYEGKVQRRVNYIQMVTSWIGSAPSIFYTLFAGALSDTSGRKPLLLLPVFGQVIKPNLHQYFYF